MSEWLETEYGKIPCSWKIINATEYCKKITDGTHDSPKQVNNGKPLITSKHIRGKEIDFNNAYHISEEDYNKIIKRSKVDRWDVIISMIGEYCGFCFIERNAKIEYAVKNVGLFKAGNEIKAKWLYYFLNSKTGRNILDAQKTGTSQPYITLGSLRNLDIIVPENEEMMYSITEVLSSLDDKIDLLHRNNKTLEELAETLFRQWFVEEADDSWEETKLGGYIKTISGYSYRSIDLNPSTTALVTLKSFDRNGGFKQDGFKEYTGKYKPEQIVHTGDLIVAHTDITQEAEVLGNPAIVIGSDKYENLIISTDIVKVEPTSYLTKQYLYFLMKSDEFKHYCLGSSNGTTVLHLSKGALPAFEFRVPQKELILKFTNIAEPLLGKMSENQLQIVQLETLRDTLLPKLMGGTIRVDTKLE